MAEATVKEDSLAKLVDGLGTLKFFFVVQVLFRGSASG